MIFHEKLNKIKKGLLYDHFNPEKSFSYDTSYENFQKAIPDHVFSHGHRLAFITMNLYLMKLS